jgi:hypothetical protein
MLDSSSSWRLDRAGSFFPQPKIYHIPTESRFKLRLEIASELYSCYARSGSKTPINRRAFVGYFFVKIELNPSRCFCMQHNHSTVFWATTTTRWARRCYASPVWWRPGRFYHLEHSLAIAEDRCWSLVVAHHLPVTTATCSTPWREPLVLHFDLSPKPLKIIDRSAR